MHCKVKMPWPFYHRDMIITIGTSYDYTNKGLVTLTKSLDPGQTFFGYTSPPEDPNVIVREDVQTLFHFFQVLGPNKTRHLT